MVLRDMEVAEDTGPKTHALLEALTVPALLRKIGGNPGASFLISLEPFLHGSIGNLGPVVQLPIEMMLDASMMIAM